MFVNPRRRYDSMQSDSKGAYQPSLSCGFLVRIRDTLRLQSLLADKKAVGIVLAPFILGA